MEAAGEEKIWLDESDVVGLRRCSLRQRKIRWLSRPLGRVLSVVVVPCSPMLSVRTDQISAIPGGDAVFNESVVFSRFLMAVISPSPPDRLRFPEHYGE